MLDVPRDTLRFLQLCGVCVVGFLYLVQVRLTVDVVTGTSEVAA